MQWFQNPSPLRETGRPQMWQRDFANFMALVTPSAWQWHDEFLTSRATGEDCCTYYTTRGVRDPMVVTLGVPLLQ